MRGAAHSDGNRELALSDYTESLKLVPNNAWVINNRAWCYRHLKDMGRSQQDARQVLQILKRPEVTDHYRLRSSAYQLLDDWESAMNEYVQLFRGRRNTDVIESDQKNLTDRVNTLEKVIGWGNKKNTAKTRFLLCMAYWYLEDKVKAEDSYKQSVELMDKNDPENHELETLRKEAEALINGSPKNTSTNNTNEPAIAPKPAK